MTKKAWLVFVLIVGLGGAVFLSVTNSFTPGLEDVKDPLGRPSALSKEVIHSASEFERITGVLVPKHGSLSHRIQRLTTVADDLDVVVDQAGHLPGKSASVNRDTSTVSEVAVPLPGLIQHITRRAVEAGPVVGDLGSSVSGVTTQIDAVGLQLTGAFEDLAALGPRARTIVDVLAQIEAESEKVRRIMPVLNALHFREVLSVLNGIGLLHLLDGTIGTLESQPLLDSLLGRVP